jgi:NAD(P)-dependent dehydrogenase (short-subunit alcohol dehydrogenase family)
MKLKYKVALVTGAAGLGKTASTALLKRGARAVILDLDAGAVAATITRAEPKNGAEKMGC